MATKDITDTQVVAAYRDSIRERVANRDAIPERKGSVQWRWPEDILRATTGEAEKVCYRAMERAHRHGLFEYGVSLRSGWLTAAGLKLLEE